MAQTSKQSFPEPYVIKGSLPNRYPRGWFCIGADYEFTNTPMKLDYFGTSLVAYRGQDSGEIHVLDAYCPHMGAHLAGAGSMVQGDSVICPFHHWSWGADGFCNYIPYANKIPARARIRAWPVMRENQLVFLWHDPDGGGPAAQIAFVNQLIDENQHGGVFADLAIWQDKTTIDNPILCDGDGPVNRLRQWYKQFLAPLDQVPASLKERRVYVKN